MTLCSHLDGRCWNQMLSVTCASVYVMLVNETASLPFIHSYSHTHTHTHTRTHTRTHRDPQNMQDSYLNQLLRLNIYRYWSISWFHLSVMTYFWWIHPNLDKFHDMKSVFKLGSAIPSAFSASRKSYGPKHQEPGWLGPRYQRYFTKPGTVTFSFF